jgi:hypothetical protein
MTMAMSQPTRSRARTSYAKKPPSMTAPTTAAWLVP